MITIALLLTVGATAPEIEAPPSASPAERTWVAKKRRRKGKAPAPLVIETALSEVRLKIKKRKATAVLVGAGDTLEVTLTGSGRLGLLVYQALSPREKKGKGAVTLEWSIDGAAQKKVSFVGKLDKRAKVYGPASAVSKPKGASAKVSGGTHTVSMSVPGGGYGAVVELQWYPGKSKTAAPLRIKPVSVPPPVADVEPPPPPDTPPPPDEPPPVEEIVAQPASDTAGDVERRIAAGEIRDGVVGTFDMLNIKNLTDGNSELCARTAAENPYVFVADGPGDVTIRVYRLASAGTPLPGSETLTILENDVLLQTFDLDSPVSTTLEVVGVASLESAVPKEYKLSLGPRLSRLSFQPSESSAEGLAISYSFAAADKSSAMSLTMDLGDEFGLGGDLGGGTTITEVAVREKVVQVVTEKVVKVKVGGDEFLGIAVGGDILAPQTRIAPAFGGGVELRLSLPFADRMISVSIASSFLQQQLKANAADPRGAQFETQTGIMMIPVTGGLVTRFRVAESFALYLTAGGGVMWTRASGDVSGTSHVASAWLPIARGGGGLEIKLGPGWLAVEAAYLYAVPADLEGVMDEYSPAGLAAALKYRLGF